MMLLFRCWPSDRRVRGGGRLRLQSVNTQFSRAGLRRAAGELSRRAVPPQRHAIMLYLQVATRRSAQFTCTVTIEQ
jgi:hypothetical protein